MWASVSVSIAALALQGVAGTSLALSAFILITLGSFLSWRRRYSRNVAVKIAVGILMLVALGSFLRQVYLEPYDPRLPMAGLFVWVQVLHSFDLPRRKDLMLVLISSLILLSLAGSYSISGSFLWLVVLWLAAALPALYYSCASRLGDLSAAPRSANPPRAAPRRIFLTVSMLLTALALTSLAVGAVMPRVSANYVRSLPFSLRRSFNPTAGYRFDNPGYPNLPMRPPSEPLRFNPEAYFGFSPFLDLRVRGRLADVEVMRVLSTEPAYWAGMTFRDYDGHAWTNPESEPRMLNTAVQPFDLQYDPEQACCSDHKVVQTFYMVNDQPNMVFAAWRPDLVYFPSDYLFQDFTGLKSPYPLSGGVVYSVVSDAPPSEAKQEAASGEAREGLARSYLQIPRQLPDRVRGLVEEIVPAAGTPYARARAIEDYLKSEYAYSLDVPPLPEGADAVDHFLFEERRGYCEHFASAYAIMCRLAGIPSRVVTGYSTGDYNPFTGLYEVGLDDAHAWVEIYLSGLGWVTREPTPGFTAPAAGRGAGSMWIFGDFVSWTASRLSSILPGPVRSALRAALSGAAAAAKAFASGFVYAARHAYWFFLLVALAVLLVYFLRAYRRRARRAALAAAGLEGASLAMYDFFTGLESLGIRRDPSQTAEEYAARLAAIAPGLNIDGELSLFEEARYGWKALAEEDLRRLAEGLQDALKKIRAAVKPRWRRRPRGPSVRIRT